MASLQSAARERLKKHIDSAVTDALKEWTEKKIKDHVTAVIGNHIGSLIAKCFGMDMRWGNAGSWEVDHCNGRDGNSIVGKHIKENCQAQVSAYLEKLGNNFPEPTPAMKAAFAKEYNAVLEARLRAQANELAAMEAKKLSDMMLGMEEEYFQIVNEKVQSEVMALKEACEMQGVNFDDLMKVRDVVVARRKVADA
jgi:hypothetical protein